jgi:hemin uptake protein HemP
MNTRCRALRTVAAFCALSATELASPAAGDDYATYTGSAMALHSQEFLYGEKHVLVDHDGRLAHQRALRPGSAQPLDLPHAAAA